LGSPDHVPLATARERRDEARRLLKDGENPSKVRKELAEPNGTAGPRSGHTFENVAREWMASREKSLTRKYASVIEKRLERHVFPKIGARDIATITGPEFLELIMGIEKEAVYLARRVKRYCGRVFKYAVTHA
jgi:hypothetical protein